MLTLDDVLKMPTDPDEEHLRSLGLLPKPAPSPSMNIGGMPAAAPGGGTLVPKMSPVNPSVQVAPNPVHGGIGEVTAPELKPMTPPAGGPEIKPMAAPTLNFKEREALPTVSPGVAAGSSQFYENKIGRAEDEKANPWGSSENHPGILGKIGHVAAKIGNIAGDIVAPGTMAIIPGTELNKKAEEENTEGKLAEAKKQETTAAVEKTREKHEENLQDVNQVKLDQAQAKIDETQRKDLSTREVNLRKQGLKLNPADPNGTPVALAYEDMSPAEQAVHDLKVAQADSQTAKAALDSIKADPNSPQNKAVLERIRVMAQNAKTAAGRLGLDGEKFVADYYGLGPDGNPLPGTAVDPKTGKPVGPKIARSTASSEGFVGTIGASVVQATATQDAVRRLMSILEPSKTDNQPFGSFWKQLEYRLGKAQTDELGKELAGINLSSLQQAGSVLKSMGGVRAYQMVNKALQHTPDPTKDSVMLMYQKMQNIDRALATFLQDADKYGRKKGAAIEPERMKPVGEAAETPAKVETAAPAPPKAGDVVDGHKFNGGDPSKKENWEKVAAEKKP